MRKVHNLIQGSPQWHAFRASCDGTASEASAMLGMSPYKTRDQLIAEKATGITEEVSASKQIIFDKGHANEAAARPVAESVVGEELYPATYSLEIDGLTLGASCDGVTMDESIAWECKTLNKELAERLPNDDIPSYLMPQLEQVLLVSGAERMMLTAFDKAYGNGVHAWYESSPLLREQLIAGWKQFKIDVDNYLHSEPAIKPIGKMIESLPALLVDVSGSLTTQSNLAEFRAGAEMIIGAIKTDLVTDQDFTDAEMAIKWLDGAEKRIDSSIENAMAKSGPLEELVRTLRDVQQNLFRSTRLNLNKQVESQKTARKNEIQFTAQKAWTEYLDECNAKLKSVRIPQIAVDFAGAIKGKRTIETLQSAANDELARAKIEATKWADHIEANLTKLREIASEYTFLFSDRQDLVLKDKDAVEAIALQRIAAHKAAEQAKIEAAAKKLADEKIEEENKKSAADKAEKLKAESEALKAAESKTEVVAPEIVPEVQTPSSTDAADPVKRSVSQPTNLFYNDIPAEPEKPSDSDIITAVAIHFDVSKDVALMWIKSMNLTAAKVA